jgi:polar amino acid transport system substrate-binding protein
MKAPLPARQRRSLGVVAIASALALCACSSGAAAGSDTAGSSGSPAVAASADPAIASLLPEKFKTAGVITVASDIPNPPMEMRDSSNNVTGFDYDLAQAMGQKLGVKFEFQQQAFDTAVPSLQAGKHDIIIAGMNDTAEREKVLDFVDYFHAGFMIVVPFGNPEKITSVMDLCGKKVAVQKATVQGQLLTSYASKCTAAGSTPITLVQLPGELDAQTAVRSGKASADVVDASVASYAAQTAGGGKIFELVRDPDNPSGYNPVYTGIGLLKGQDELAKALSAALQAVIDDGTYPKLLAKYDLASFAVDKAGINLATQ